VHPAKYVLRFTTLLLLITLVALPAYSATVAWINPAGGNWNNTANWSTGTVPTVGDIVYINLDGTYVVTLDMNPTINSLTIGGFSGTQTLRMTSWYVNVTGTTTINENGVLDITSSELRTTGDFILNNYGLVELDNSDIQHKVNNYGDMLLSRTCAFDRSFLNDTNATFTIQGTSGGSAYLTVDTNFTNRGTIDLTTVWPPTTTTARITVNKGSLVNEATGTINALIGDGFSTISGRSLYAQVDNAGTITSNTNFSIYKEGADHVNTGTYHVYDGTLTFTTTGTASSFSHTGTIETDAAGTFVCAADTVAWPSGTITNNGVVSFPGAVVSFTPKWTNYGRLQITGTGSVLNLTDSLINEGTVLLDVGTLAGSPILNKDSFLVVDGTVDVDVRNEGVMRVNETPTINGTYVSVPGSKIIAEATTSRMCILAFANAFTNHGEIELTQADYQTAYISLLTVTDTLINASDGTITTTAGAGSPTGDRYIACLMHNEGTINVEDAPLYISNGASHQLNSGTININGSNLNCYDDFTNTGTIAVDSGHYFFQHTDNFHTSTGGFTGLGTVSFLNDTLFVSGAATNAAIISVGGAHVANSGSLTNTGSIRFSAATGSGSGTLTNQGSVEMISSTLSGTVANEGLLTATLTNTISGILTNGFDDTVIVSGSSSGSGTLTVTNGITNYGHIDLTSDQANGTTTATLNVTNNSLTNSAAGTIRSEAGSSTGGERTLGAQLVNQGTVTTHGIKLVLEKSSANHSNSGTIDLGTAAVDVNLTGAGGSFSNTGIIHFQNMMTMTFDQGTFANATTGQITGSGSLNTYATTFTNDGRVSPGDSPGTINMQANDFPMASNAQIDIEIAGLTVITEHDRVYCTQNAAYGGVLNIELIDGYIPAVDDSFKVLNYNARTSNFLAILGLNQLGVEFDTNFVADGMYLVTKSITNDPPVITGMPATLSFENDTTALMGIWNYASDDYNNDSNLTYDFTVSNDSLVYELNAAGFLILSATGGFTGDVTLILTVTDWHGATAVDTTIVTVIDPNTAPVLAGVPDSTTFDADSSLNLYVWGYVTDAESHDSLLDYTFSVTNDSLVFAYDTSMGVLTVSSISGYNGSPWLNMTVADPEGAEAEDSIKFIITYNFPPVIAGLPDSVDFRADSNHYFNIWGSVTDVELHDSLLTYDFTVSNDSLQTVWVATTGYLVLSSVTGFVGDGSLFITVTDTGGLAAVDTIFATVRAIPNAAPVFSLPDTATFQNGSTLSFTIWDYVEDVATDDSLLTYGFSVTNDSVNWSFFPTSGLTQITADSGFVGTADLIVTATDPEAAVGADTMVIEVIPQPNTAPVVSLPDSLSFTTGSTLGFSLWNFVTDAESADSLLTYTIVTSNDSLDYAFTAATGMLALNDDPAWTGTALLIVTVEDPGGASDVDTTVITVTTEPNTYPVITGLPDSISLRVDSTYEIDLYAAVLDAETNDSMLTYTFSRDVVALEQEWNDTTGTVTLIVNSMLATDTVAHFYIQVDDPGMLSAYDTIVVSIHQVPNTPPVVDLPDSLEFNADTSATLNIWSMVTDDDHDTLMYYAFSASNDSLERSWNAATGVLTVSATAGFSGDAILRLAVTDPDSVVALDSCFVTIHPILSVEDPELLPDDFALSQNYPNPFNPNTVIEYSLPVQAYVTLTVFNVLGQEVTRLAEGSKGAGTHTVTWNGTDIRGRMVTSGAYFYRLEAGDFKATRKMLLLK